MAELASTARGRGGDGGRGVTVARLRLRSASEREQRGGGGAERERGAVRGGVVASPGRRGGSGKQEVAGTRAGALRPHTLVPTGTRLRMTGTWAWWAGFSAGPGK